MPEIQPFFYIVKTRVTQNYLDDPSNPLGLALVPHIGENGAISWTYLIPDKYLWALPGDGDWYLLGIFTNPWLAREVTEKLSATPAVQLGYTEVAWELWSVRTIEDHITWDGNPDDLFPKIDTFYPEGAVNLSSHWTIPVAELDQFLNPEPVH